MNKLFPIVLALLCFGCEKTVHGCLDSKATNYNSDANIDNNSCTYLCTNSSADNYNSIGPCIYKSMKLSVSASEEKSVEVSAVRAIECVTYYVGYEQSIPSNAVSCELIFLTSAKENGPTEYKCLFNTKEECLEIDDDSGCVEEEKCNE